MKFCTSNQRFQLHTVALPLDNFFPKDNKLKRIENRVHLRRRRFSALGTSLKNSSKTILKNFV